MLNQPHYKAYFDKLLKEAHGDEPIPVELNDFYRALPLSPGITAAELDRLGTMLKVSYFPESSFNQIRRKIFAALGYRSNGLADVIRVRYTQAHAFNELCYPNLWDQFSDGYEESVFGSDFYGPKKFVIPYLEMLYEPHLIFYQISEEHASQLLSELEANPQLLTNERFTQGFYLYLDLAQEKTTSVAMVREWAHLLSVVVDVGVPEALDIAAIALGYKAWARALAAATEGSITNQRYQWAYA